jgi:HlyD family secretion protein
VRSRIATVVVTIVLAACGGKEDYAVLGTTEWDRIALTAQAQEPIVALHVHEGERVTVGQALIDQDRVRTRREGEAAAAEVERLEALLTQQLNGARPETIEAARARLRGAQSVEVQTKLTFERASEMRKAKLNSQSDLDAARRAHDTARAETAAARAELALLLNGTRAEEIAQTGAALAAARARLEQAQVTLSRLAAVAPREGWVDAIPVRVGDQPAPGATLISMLVGDAAFARVYVPERLRANIGVGAAFRLTVEGVDGEFAARVRWIRAEPSFTPYYALTGDDVSRLTWVAELTLDGERAKTLPAGLPVRAWPADGLK